MDSRPTLLGFSGAYAAAVLAGLISTVPAGLGVFESVILLLLPGIPAISCSVACSSTVRSTTGRRLHSPPRCL